MEASCKAIGYDKWDDCLANWHRQLPNAAQKRLPLVSGKRIKAAIAGNERLSQLACETLAAFLSAQLGRIILPKDIAYLDGKGNMEAVRNLLTNVFPSHFPYYFSEEQIRRAHEHLVTAEFHCESLAQDISNLTRDEALALGTLAVRVNACHWIFNESNRQRVRPLLSNIGYQIADRADLRETGEGYFLRSTLLYTDVERESPGFYNWTKQLTGEQYCHIVKGNQLAEHYVHQAIKDYTSRRIPIPSILKEHQAMQAQLRAWLAAQTTDQGMVEIMENKKSVADLITIATEAAEASESNLLIASCAVMEGIALRLEHPRQPKLWIPPLGKGHCLYRERFGSQPQNLVASALLLMTEDNQTKDIKKREDRDYVEETIRSTVVDGSDGIRYSELRKSLP